MWSLKGGKDALLRNYKGNVNYNFFFLNYSYTLLILD
jgi:hypothetical protein